MGWWVVVGVYGQGPQAAMTASRSSLPTMPSPSTSASGSSLLQASRTASRSWTACNVAQRDATEDSEAGEGIRTLNIQLGRLTKSGVSDASEGARSPGRSAENANEVALEKLLAAWPSLSHAMREQIAALAEAACQPLEP